MRHLKGFMMQIRQFSFDFPLVHTLLPPAFSSSLPRSDKNSKINFYVFRFTKRFEFVIIRLHVLEKARFDSKQILSDLDSCKEKIGNSIHFL